MAYGDETGGAGSPKYVPKTAQQNAFVVEYEQEDRLYREDKARAEAANVTGVDKIDYAAALQNYESRSDVELLVNRRARENAVSFAEQNFTRQAVSEAAPLQSSTVGSTTVVRGDTYSDGPDAGTGDDVTARAPSRT